MNVPESDIRFSLLAEFIHKSSPFRRARAQKSIGEKNTTFVLDLKAYRNYKTPPSASIN